MKGNPYKMGKMATKSAMKMAKEAMKMKKESMAKLKEESAMKLKTSYKMKEAMAKMKEASAMKQAKPDYPDIDGDGNTTESMKKAAADKKTAMKQRVPRDKDQKKIQDKIDLEVRKKQLRLDEAERPNKKDVGPRKAGMSKAMAAETTTASGKAKSPNKLMGRVKKKVNKELETPAGQAMMKAASGGMMMKDDKKKKKTLPKPGDKSFTDLMHREPKLTLYRQPNKKTKRTIRRKK